MKRNNKGMIKITYKTLFKYLKPLTLSSQALKIWYSIYVYFFPFTFTLKSTERMLFKLRVYSFFPFVHLKSCFSYIKENKDAKHVWKLYIHNTAMIFSGLVDSESTNHPHKTMKT